MWTDRQPLLSADAFLISINRRSHHTILHGINYSTCLNSVPTYRDISIVYPRSGQAEAGNLWLIFAGARL